MGMSPYKVVFGDPCRLLVELEHRAWWVIRSLKFDLSGVGKEKNLSLNKLEEIMQEAYDNTRLSKECAKILHDKLIHRKQFCPSQ